MIYWLINTRTPDYNQIYDMCEENTAYESVITNRWSPCFMEDIKLENEKAISS